MFSMCGLLCRFLRGWRQSEAVGLMVHAASLRDSSLIVETTTVCAKSTHSQDEQSISLFCQPFCKQSEKKHHQLLWRDNNKQATLVTPKEKVDLVRWTLFLANSPPVKEECRCSSERGFYPPVTSLPSYSSTPASSRRNSGCSECENIITVLLEASFREKEEESLYGYTVMVEQLAEPYAWKVRDMFGVIIYTTPTKLVSMIHAFFNNALIIDDDLSIRKILTVDLVGEPSSLRDPSTISDSVTPGPWSHSGNVYSQMELARANTPAVVSFSFMKAQKRQELNEQRMLKEGEGALLEPKHPSLVEAQKVSSSQSSEEEGSSESESTSLDFQQLCPRGWAVSGLKAKHNFPFKAKHKVVLGQPLPGASGLLLPEGKLHISSQSPTLQPSSLFTSIISNPLNDFLAVKEALTHRSRYDNNRKPKERKSSFDISKGLDRFFNQRDLTNPLLQYLPQVHKQCSSTMKTKEALGFSPKLCRSPPMLSSAVSFHGKETLASRLTPSISIDNEEASLVHEPKFHDQPTKMKSEADLLKATNLIKDNLANIVENYLKKSPEVPHRNLYNNQDNSDPRVLLIDNDNDETNSESILMVTMESPSDLTDATTPFPATSINSELLLFEHSDDATIESSFVSTSSDDIQQEVQSVSRESFYLNESKSSPPVCLDNLGSFITSEVGNSEEERTNNILIPTLPWAIEPLAKCANEELSESVFQINQTLSPQSLVSEMGADIKERGRLERTQAQGSVESDPTELSFSEDSLNEKIVPEEKLMSINETTMGTAAPECQDAAPCEDKISRPNSIHIEETSLWKMESIGNEEEKDVTTNENADFTSDLGEDVCSSQVWTGGDDTLHSDNQLEQNQIRGEVVESNLGGTLAQLLFNEDGDSPLDDSVKSLCNSVSFEEYSFSEDSLASAKEFDPSNTRQNPTLGAKGEVIDSQLSTPEDFTTGKSDESVEDFSSSGLPSHWHEEYVKVFTDANQEMLDGVQRASADLSPHSLDPIKEMKSIRKDDFTFANDEPKRNRNLFMPSSPSSNTIHISYFPKNKLHTILEAQSASKSEEDLYSLCEESPTSLSPVSFGTTFSFDEPQKLKRDSVDGNLLNSEVIMKMFSQSMSIQENEANVEPDLGIENSFSSLKQGNDFNFEADLGVENNFSPFKQGNEINFDADLGVENNFSPMKRGNDFNFEADLGVENNFSPMKQGNEINYEANLGVENNISLLKQGNEINFEADLGVENSFSPLKQGNEINFAADLGVENSFSPLKQGNEINFAADLGVENSFSPLKQGNEINYEADLGVVEKSISSLKQEPHVDSEYKPEDETVNPKEMLFSSNSESEDNTWKLRIDSTSQNDLPEDELKSSKNLGKSSESEVLDGFANFEVSNSDDTILEMDSVVNIDLPHPEMSDFGDCELYAHDNKANFEVSNSDDTILEIDSLVNTDLPHPEVSDFGDRELYAYDNEGFSDESESCLTKDESFPSKDEQYEICSSVQNEDEGHFDFHGNETITTQSPISNSEDKPVFFDRHTGTQSPEPSAPHEDMATPSLADTINKDHYDDANMAQTLPQNLSPVRNSELNSEFTENPFDGEPLRQENEEWPYPPGDTIQENNSVNRQDDEFGDESMDTHGEKETLFPGFLHICQSGDSLREDFEEEGDVVCSESLHSSSFVRSDEGFVYSPLAKAALSPVDSAPESGFASLKDSSHSEATSDSGSCVPLSKSKDSLEMTDSERDRAAGADTLLDEFEGFSCFPGAHIPVQSGSSPASAVSSARGSLLDELVFSHSKDLDTLDIENVRIPSDHSDGNCDLFSLSSSPLPTSKNAKLISVASLDSDHRLPGYLKGPDRPKLIASNAQDRDTELIHSCSPCPSKTQSFDDHRLVEDSEPTDERFGPSLKGSDEGNRGAIIRKDSEEGAGEFNKSGAEDVEGQILKTSDSVSSSDTIISRVSIEELGITHVRQPDLDPYEPQSKTYPTQDSFNLQSTGQYLIDSVPGRSNQVLSSKLISEEGVPSGVLSGMKLDGAPCNGKPPKPPRETKARMLTQPIRKLEINHPNDYETRSLSEVPVSSIVENDIKKLQSTRATKPKSLEEVVNKKYALFSDHEMSETQKFLSKSLSYGKDDCQNGNATPICHNDKKEQRLTSAKRDPNMKSDDSLYSFRGKNKEKKLSLFHSENNLGNSSSYDKSCDGSQDRSSSLSSRSNTTHSSSGEGFAEKVSLRSQDSLDRFDHFDAIRAQAKPRSSGRRRKVLSVDVETTTGVEKAAKEGSESLQRSVTLPVGPLETLPLLSKEEKDTILPKEEKSEKKKSKDTGQRGGEKEKKSSLLSLKGFLKRHKSKETTKEKSGSEKKGSPSLFRKLKSGSLLRSEEKLASHTRVPISHPSPITKVDNVGKVDSPNECVDEITNGKTHCISNGSVLPPVIKESATIMGTKSPLQRSNAFPGSFSQSGSESDASSPGGSPLPKRSSLGESPLLYRRVLMRNLSSSQESLESPTVYPPSKGASPSFVSRRRRSESSTFSPSTPPSPAPLMGTRALQSSPKRFSVTIGFKPQVKPPSKNRTMSIGEELHRVTAASATLPSRSASRSPASTLTKRSSSMEILVYGKIREHNPGRKRSSGASSREGSFKLHREISVETLVEVPEAGVLHPQKENYEDYLRRVQDSRDSRQSSAWSLCENDGSSVSESLPIDPFTPTHHNPLQKKFSLPHSLHLSGPAEEMSTSNPNLSSRVGSPFSSKLPLSSSFTSSPFRRSSGPPSSSAGFSPIKRGFAGQGKSSITSPGNDSCPASPLVEEEEEVDGGREEREEDEEEVSETERPPNVLVYTTNNQEYFEDVKETLLQSLGSDRYVIYHLSDEMAFKSPWKASTTLLVVCGDVPTHVSTVFIRYLLSGGKVLSICSDFLNVAVPLFGSVEVQEAAVVSMSYSKWKNVQLLHHQHCFHSSPKHQRYSFQHLEKKVSNSSGSAVSVEPTFVEITDEYGVKHGLALNVLAKDDTWKAPSLLVATVNEGQGKALFSQVHLEKDPNKSICLHLKKEQLKKCNESRLDILRDLLTSHLGLEVGEEYEKDQTPLPPTCTPAYVLGKFEMKQKFMQEMKPYMTDGKLVRPSLTLQIHKEGEKAPEPSQNTLPVFVTGYPTHFSTVKYFEELKTSSIGRLLIYSDILSSTMDVLAGNPPVGDGVVVIATQQFGGKGRRGNVWLSPPGCAMFSLQLHFPLSSKMGQCLPFLQHLAALSIVLGVKGMPGYEDIPLFLKWPNDIYLGRRTKVGGVLVEASTQKGVAIVNLGCGVNLSNSSPTCSINEAIRDHNDTMGTRLMELERETLFANVFNQMERLLEEFQNKSSESVIDEYYKHWLHGGAQVSVQNDCGQVDTATVTGIDPFGFLIASLSTGEPIALHPDGNSFDMMEGLIYTKLSRS